MHFQGQVKGNVTYNGHTLDEFVPQKTSVYISQQDLHVAEMTVRETLDFSARCQGIGTRYGKWGKWLAVKRFVEGYMYAFVRGKVLTGSTSMFAEMLAELAKREKQAGIFPEKDVDVYMKVGAFTSLSYPHVYISWL